MNVEEREKEKIILNGMTYPTIENNDVSEV